MLKKILLALVFMITAITGVTHAEDDMKTVASKAYVDTKIETKQLKIPAAGQPNVGAGETVMTYTSTGNGQIGERALYSDISSYDANADGDKLITASALNATFTNLPTTPTTKLECANSPACTLWTIVDQTAYGDMLPSGYTRLEYIESTGIQYIDTGIYPTNTTETMVVGQYTELSNNDSIFGALESNGRNYYGLGLANSGTEWRLWYGSGTAPWVFFGVPDTSKHTFLLRNKSLYIDNLDTPVAVSPRSCPTQAQTMFLFAANFAGRFYTPSKTKIFSAVIKNDNTLVRNFIPAKDSSNVIGMYDTVSGTFFTNAATDGPDFTPGPPAN
jgi:hypothetical protein